jgi:alkylation response protein AidB-like acyl-CoA dehydrogenase
LTSLDLIPDPSTVLSAEWEHWLTVADDVAAILRADVVERDAANRLPVAEIDLLRSHGLLRLALPAASGGTGQPFALAAQVARRIARVDAGVAHILAYHYAWTRILGSLDSSTGERLLAETVEHDWLWASPGSARLVGLVKLRNDGDHFVLNGDVGFATGAPVAGRLFCQVMDEATGNLNIVAVDPASAGITIGSDWDMVGQRLSASPAVSFSEVSVPSTELIKEFGPVTEVQSPFQSVKVLNFQLLFGVLQLGIAEGALGEATAFARDKSAPWMHSTAESIGDEPFILNTIGGYLAKLQSVSALLERNERRLQWLIDQGSAVTAEQRAQVAETIASSKVVSTQIALEVTSGIFDITGARSAATRYGLDRHWRNVRTISLHDPVAYKLNELGRYFLNGEFPRPSGYR